MSALPECARLCRNAFQAVFLPKMNTPSSQCDALEDVDLKRRAAPKVINTSLRSEIFLINQPT